MIATSQFTISVINDGATGATGPQGVSVTKVVEEYRLSNSSTELTGSGTGYTWSETKPDIPSGKYLWIRERTDLSNNTSSYGTAHCDIVISGLVQDVDRNSNAITSKVWESDITTKINEYDGSTGAAIRNRVSQTETNISGITSRVSDVESETDSLGTRMTSAESSITQNADNIALMVTVDGTSSSLTLTQNMLTAMTSQFVVKDPAGSATIISGGKIHANAITTAMLATDAIKSTNYSSGTSGSDVPANNYSTSGTFLDLTTGNIYTPNFAVNSVNGEAYLNGTIFASAGQIGNPGDAYWSIGTVYDSTWGDYAGFIANGNALIQSGKLTLSSDRLNSQNAGNYIQSGGYWYDFGLQVPDFTAGTNSHDQNFLYVRRIGHQPTDSTLDTDWSYLFRVDKAGNIYWNGHDISDGTFLPLSGGTVTGATTFSNNLTVSGAFTASGNINTNLMIQTNLASTSAAQLTGNANATVIHGVTGTLGVGNGGTGKSSWTANQIVYASASNTLSQLGAGTSGQILKSNGSSAPSWVNQSTLSVGNATKATQDGNGNVIVNTYMPIAGGQFTGAVYVPDEFSADSAQLGSLIVNGAARFTNDVFADTFTGNLVGTASNAVKVGNNLVIKLNGGSTEGTNLFTYNGSATKTINITASSIGAQASGTYAGGISNGGAASKLAYQAGNEINFVSTADTPTSEIYFNWRNGRTDAKTGTSSNIGYYFENYNGEYNHTTLYAAQFSGNAATATKLANARTITLSGSVTGSTTFDGSGNVTIATTTNHTHNYAGSSSAGGSANTVAGETGSVNAARHVWFSDSSTETKRNYDDDFKYNPSTNVLTVGSITGNAATATKVNKSLKMANNKSFDGSADVNLFTNDLIPAISKTYTSTAYYSTDNSWDNSSWYFMSVKPDSWYKTWRVKFKIRSYCPSYTNVDSTSWVEVYGRANSPTSYKIYNEFYDRGHYYVNVYPLTSTGFNAGYGHAIGISIRYATNYTNSAYYRTFEVDYFNSDGCTVTVLDTPVKWASWSGTGTTNYGGINNFDAVNRGLRETGDDNNYDMLQMSTNYMYNGDTLRMPPYSLMGIDRSGHAQAISLYSANYEGSTGSVNTARVYNTAGIDWTQGIYYLTSSTNFAKSAVLQTSLRLAYTALDFRYTDNNVASSTANNLGMVSYKPVYFRGVIKNDGLFYLAPISVTYNNSTYQRAWTQDIPTSVETDGTYQYVYWFLGYPYYNSSYANSQYQLNLFSENKMYWYHNNRFEEYLQESAYSDKANHANLTSTANAVAYYTDTMGTFGSKASANGALYATSTNGALQWGTLPVAQGGTGLTSSPSILVNLASTSATNVMAASPRPGVTGTLPIANGGTGATTADGIKTNLSLNNVTNNKQVKGLASGTISGHLVSWGSDGYTVADSGITTSGVNKTVTSLASNDDGKIVLTYLDGTTSTPIEVKIIGQSGSSVSYADALNVNGTAVGGSEQPVYINNQGKPATANKIPKLNNTTTGGAFYAPTSTGTANQVLVSSGTGAPTWTNQSSLSVGSATNATTAGAFSSAKSVTLTGDTTGTASSTAGWSITTTTTRLSTVGDKRSEETTPNSYANKLIFQGLKGKSTIGSPSNDTYSYLIGLRGWSDSSGGKAHELAFNDSGINHRSGSTTTWDAWEKLVTSANYTDYTVTKTGTGASGTWGISISGNAATATTATTAGAFTSAKSVTLTGDTTGTASSTGGWSLATTTNKLSYQPKLTTQDAIDSFIETSKFMAATFGTTDANNVGMGSNDGMIMSLAWGSTAYGAQIALDDTATGALKFRGRANSVWGDWRTVIHDGNYTNYTVTKSGTGASGTWGISVTGNAATATKLATSRSLWGNSFDGSSNITGHIKLPATNSVIQTLADTSNWGLGLGWDKTTSYTQSYRPGIGFHNTGGNNGNGSISIVPYAQDTGPWGGSVGLFLTQDEIKFNNVSLVKNSGTWGISITGNASTATKWASAQTVYVALGTASKTTSIQGGSSSAVTLGVDGVLGVANGGTGASSFTANSVIMSGSSTTGAFTTRAVTNNTSASAVTANTNLITANTLAYWTGSSNLTTCSQGTFGTAATYSATTSVTSGSSALVTSGGVSSALGNYVTLSTAQTISGAKTFSAVTSITNTTASTSKSTGALKVSGGVGISGQMSANTVMIGDAVSLVYDSSISALCFQFD